MLNVYDAMLSDPGYFKQLCVKDALLLNYQCPQMERWVDLYTHYNHIIYTLEGKKIVSRPGISKELTEGSLIFLKKGAFNQGRFHDVEWKVIVFCISDNYLQRLFQEYRPQLPLQRLPSPSTESLIELQTDGLIQGYFYGLLPYFTLQPPPPENLLELKFRELILTILSNPGNAGLLSYLNGLSDYVKPPLPDIMEANFSYNLSLEEFARISQRSLTIFKKEFTQLFQTSPGKWLVRKRLDYARNLLVSSEKNVNEIACDCGFESATHFSRVFKEQFGRSPLQFRKTELQG
jgi:AraC family transcriptional regulator, exoenzyme S synthesis regulatory protein ExsA